MSLSAQPPVSTGEAANLGTSLMEKWARLEPLWLAGSAGTSPPSFELDDTELKLVSVWADLFKEELEAVRTTRNFVTHLGPAGVAVTDLVEANDFADRLLQLLVARVPRLSAVLGVELPTTPWWDLPPEGAHS